MFYVFFLFNLELISFRKVEMHLPKLLVQFQLFKKLIWTQNDMITYTCMKNMKNHDLIYFAWNCRSGSYIPYSVFKSFILFLEGL